MLKSIPLTQSELFSVQDSPFPTPVRSNTRFPHLCFSVKTSVVVVHRGFLYTSSFECVNFDFAPESKLRLNTLYGFRIRN